MQRALLPGQNSPATPKNHELDKNWWLRRGKGFVMGISRAWRSRHRLSAALIGSPSDALRGLL